MKLDSSILKDLGKIPDLIIDLSKDYAQYWWVAIMVLVIYGFYVIFGT